MFILFIVLVLAFGFFYWFRLRKWFLNWGASAFEQARVMEGDYIIKQPTDMSTQVITIAAPASLIWPWLVQMGYGRGGLYSYDWLDQVFGFLDRPSSDIILAPFQKLHLGDTISLGPRQTLFVAKIIPNVALILVSHEYNMDWVWQFGLYPMDAQHTRLVTRGSERIPRKALSWLSMRILEPTGFIMTRKMLLGIKKRSEKLSVSF